MAIGAMAIEASRLLARRLKRLGYPGGFPRKNKDLYLS